MKAGTPPNAIPIGPLAVVCFAWLLATALLVPHTAVWATSGLLGSIALRLLSSTLGWPQPSQPVKLVFLAIGAGLIGLTYGTFRGMAPGIGILLLLSALKLLEAKNIRDFQVLVLLGYFLGLSDLFFSQDLGTALLVVLIVALLTVALIRFHHETSFGRATRLASAITLQALPIIALLFLAFPRISGGMRPQFGASTQNLSGMSEEMEPGSVASLASQNDIAFQVSFPDDNVPAMPDLYWRGVVLWYADGLTWLRGTTLSVEDRGMNLAGEPIRQVIRLQPHGGNWLFALDRPALYVFGASFESGGCLRSQPVNYARRYEVVSKTVNQERALAADQFEAAVQKPSHVSPAMRTLVDGWTQGATDRQQIIRRGLEFFRNGKFTYSLTPGAYSGSNAIDEFLFHRRIGFCEHYAGAFASLMRIAGIPSRVVLGYHGGDFNGFEVTVRQSDAHAWCEVWLKGIGWQRVDPTGVIAPGRITEGWDSYRASQVSTTGGLPSALHLQSLRRFLDQTHLFWANLTFQWDLHVLNYGSEQKNSILSRLGFPLWRDDELLLCVGGIVFLLLAAIALWLARPRPGLRDAGVHWFDRFCNRLAAAGIERQPWEGPLHFSARAAERFPEKAEAIQTVGRIYAQHRYGKTGARLEELARAVRSLGRFPKGKK